MLQSELSFDANGKLQSDQEAVFKNLPHSALLTMIMDTPQSWMIEASGSNQDLDNIFLGQANELVYGDFELEHIIIEGVYFFTTYFYKIHFQAKFNINS